VIETNIWAAEVLKHQLPEAQGIFDNPNAVPYANLRGAYSSAGGLPNRRNRGDVAGDHHADESAQAGMSISGRSLCCPPAHLAIKRLERSRGSLRHFRTARYERFLP
jgi:hypothetical protein